MLSSCNDQNLEYTFYKDTIYKIMGVYRWPIRKEEQVEICQKLSNISLLSFDEKRECQRLAQELGRYKQLSVSEKSFLEGMVKKHGFRL